MYSEHTAHRWTRIEMLLELYDATIASLEQAEAARLADDQASLASNLLRAQQLIIGIMAGFDRESTEIVARLEQLLLFVIDSLRRRDLPAALRVLRTLREAYDGIRPEAIALERQGQIPRLENIASITINA